MARGWHGDEVGWEGLPRRTGWEATSKKALIPKATIVVNKCRQDGAALAFTCGFFLSRSNVQSKKS